MSRTASEIGKNTGIMCQKWRGRLLGGIRDYVSFTVVKFLNVSIHHYFDHALSVRFRVSHGFLASSGVMECVPCDLKNKTDVKSSDSLYSKAPREQTPRKIPGTPCSLLDSWPRLEDSWSWSLGLGLGLGRCWGGVRRGDGQRCGSSLRGMGRRCWGVWVEGGGPETCQVTLSAVLGLWDRTGFHFPSKTSRRVLCQRPFSSFFI